MKFFFCEACGNRITDYELESGEGRDKKLNGIYCNRCAVGVITLHKQPSVTGPMIDTTKKRRTSGLFVSARKSSHILHGIQFNAAPIRLKKAKLQSDYRYILPVFIFAVLLAGVFLWRSKNSAIQEPVVTRRNATQSDAKASRATIKPKVASSPGSPGQSTGIINGDALPLSSEKK